MIHYYVRLSACLCVLCLSIPCLAAGIDSPPPADAALRPPADAPVALLPLPVENFQGYWVWAEGDSRFTLTLTQTDDKLSGFHSVTLYGGGKEDTVSPRQTPSIAGNVHDNETVVRFRSGAPGSEAYGHARLSLRGRYLYWQLMDSTGEHYLPKNAVLIRQKQ